MVGEIFKVIFKKKEELYKLIPILVSLLGGLLGVIVYLTLPKMIFNVANEYEAMLIGITSGASATTTNQIIKQMFNK
jgi:hypothetical protein